MSTHPLVSIIMPIYNMERFLAETLDSVLATTYAELEVVLVDDGSTDSSLQIANNYAQRDARLKVYEQKNAGACAARNHAITLAKGEFILPVDGDNLITPDFVELAVAAITKGENIKVVTPRTELFGDKTGEWILPPFSLNLLARKNLIDTTAMYRRSDWESVGGYCNELMTREDWDFWISMLKDGGEVVRLDKVVFFYRRRGDSKRVRGRKLHKHVVDTLNRRHAEFFKRELGGRLHYRRSLSKVINRINGVFAGSSMLYKLKKIATAIVDSLLPERCQETPKLIMTLLVKDEEERLEKMLMFNKRMGVDAFIVTDNNSTDSTPSIIKKYVDKGWIVESIHEPDTGYKQKKWVDRMVVSAKTRHAADWVINADADEMWYSPSGDLKTEMKGRVNTLRCRLVNVYPAQSSNFWEWTEMARPIKNITDYNLSPYNRFRSGYIHKVAHSTRGYIKISEGNHKVTMLPKRQQDSEIIIYHYSLLSREQFVEKMRGGGEQMESNPNKKMARHWRYFYELYKQGGLEAEYDRVIGKEYYTEFRQNGYIYDDARPAEIFKEILSVKK